ncbi:MAG: hypothetical protein EPN17_12090 [Methylobacter sp.]|nr:MAG: hypothetical protein EPN17_12090 [Methylobacter sp.]
MRVLWLGRLLKHAPISFSFADRTTTCETLWLGVPLVTVTGSAKSVTDESQTFPARFASRMG